MLLVTSIKNKIMKFILIIMLLLNTAASKHTANILVLSPLNLRNLDQMVHPLVKSLLDRGHNITIVSPIPVPEHHNLTQIMNRKFSFGGTVDFTKVSILYNMFIGNKASTLIASELLENLEIQSLLLSDTNFDLLISTDLPLCPSLAVFDYRFNAHGVTIINHSSSSHSLWLLGEPFNPAYQPEVKSPFDDQMTLSERLYNLYITSLTIIYTYIKDLPTHEYVLDSYSEALPFLKDRPPLTDIIANKSLVLITSHPASDYIHPHSERVRQIAGINIQKNRTLPKHLEDFMTESEHGVILLSWGSLIIGSKIVGCKNTLLSAFKRVKQNVIWKYTNFTTSEPIPPNVMIVDWLPQQDILAHENLRLFMSHGGLNSITEATHYGVPLILTPLYFDQRKNAKKMVNSGMGIMLDIDNITVDSVLWSINKMINNPRYKETAVKRSKMFKDRILSPVDEAVYWIEYILKHGNVLQPATSAMPYYKTFLLDIILIVIFTVTITLYLILIIFKFIFKFVRNLFIKSSKLTLTSKKNN